VIVLVPIAFAAGVITVFAPCILPVLPIVLAGGVGKRRPYAIAAGLVTTFTAFLLAGAWLWGLLGIGKQHQIQIGAVLLGLLAITLIVPKVGEWAERPLAFMTRRRFGDAGGGFLLGAGLGLVFIPCGGPVLAALTSNVARARVGGWLVVIAIAYALGAALPMLAIAAALHDHTYDEIILSTFLPSISRWVKLDLPQRVKRRYHLPVTHLITELDTTGTHQ